MARRIRGRKNNKSAGLTSCEAAPNRKKERKKNFAQISPTPFDNLMLSTQGKGMKNEDERPEFPGLELLKKSPGFKMLEKLDSLNKFQSRAMAAWYRKGGTTDHPVSGLKTFGGKSYVVLWAVLSSKKNIVACYRILNTGQLKRLVRWPKGLEK
jgi:hypothetical protein